MNVKEIIQKYLKANEFDGLFEDGECGCLIDDLAPCGSDALLDCKPGYKRLPTEHEDPEFEFMIGSDKPEVLEEGKAGGTA